MAVEFLDEAPQGGVEFLDEAPQMAASGRTPEQEALAQQFIAEAQRPTLDKLIEGSLAAGGALVNPLISIAKGVGEIPAALNQPSTIIPSGAEAARRVGMDIINLGRGAARQFPATLTMGPAGAPIDLYNQISGLASRTPSQQEVDAFVADQPFEQALAQERQAVAFPGANPALSEGIAQSVELAPPVKGLKTIITGVDVGAQSVERIIRSALKPKTQLGVRVETAAKETIGDIYHANPNADKLGTMPIEGFQQTVSEVKKAVGQEFDAALKKNNVPITAGDDIAEALNAEANRLEKAGQPSRNVELLRNRANDFAGKVTDMEALRTATTLANRELTPAFTRTREAANPLLAQADTIANKIIAEKGGTIQNKYLESVKGPEGASLRKKWSDLTLLEGQASDRLNKIINSAPSEIQSTLVGTLTSLEGVGGLIGLVQGYAAGAIPLATSAAKAWAKRSDKLLRDSNSLITKAYDKLRANPPPAPVRTPIESVPYAGAVPPTIEEARNLAMAQSASAREIPNLPTSGPLLTPEFGVAPSPAAVLPGQANLDALIASYGQPNPMGPFPQRAPLNQLEQAMVNAQAAAAARQAAQRAAELRGTLSYF